MRSQLAPRSYPSTPRVLRFQTSRNDRSELSDDSTADSYRVDEEVDDREQKEQAQVSLYGV